MARAVTEASDLYAVGVILYELLAGRTPFGGPDDSLIAQIRAGQPRLPIEIDPRVRRRRHDQRAARPDDG